MKNLPIAFLLLSAVLATGARAQDNPDGDRPFLSHLFSSNMVLQRGMKDPVWGWTTPGTAVTVSMGNQRDTVVAAADGKWMAHTPSLPAGGPYSVTVTGPQTVTLQNVLVGDVWIASGQSNMEMGIGMVKNAEDEIAHANYPELRLFTVAKSIAVQPRAGIPPPRPDLADQWVVTTPDTVKTGGWGGFSAAGYFFGRDLYQALKIPIGIIHTSWGGTPAEAWTSASALQSMPDYRPAVAEIQHLAGGKTPDEAQFREQSDAWYQKNDPGSATGIGWADPGYDAAGWKSMTLPTYWEAAGLPDFDGVVWYRKEIDLPEDAAGKEATLHLGPIDDRDTTWVNGVRVGGLDQYNLSRDYKIPANVLKAGKNVIAVRVLDTGGNGGIYGKPEQMNLEIPGSPSLSLAGPWNYQVGVPLAKTTPVPVKITVDQNAPTTLFNGMIAPLIPYGIRGAIWYQGESNAGKAYQYRTLLPTMIRDWRTRWGEGNFPFLIVQLANFMATKPEPGEDAWAELREAQLMTSETLPRTGLAVITDIGDARDIHPKDKQDVGYRLALIALATVYGQKMEYSGPIYKSMKVEGNQIRLSFRHVDGGLVAKGGPLQGFAIAGDDPEHHFVWADARIDGDTIVVSSPQVPHPAAVRYAWASNPVANLYNKAGLPASSFRTDTWPGLTVNNK